MHLNSLKLKEELSRVSVKKYQNISHKKNKTQFLSKRASGIAQVSINLFSDITERRIIERVVWNSIEKESKDQNIFIARQQDLIENRACHKILNSFFDESSSLIDKELM